MTNKKLCFKCGKKCPKKELKKWGKYDYMCDECTKKYCVEKEPEDYLL